MSKWRAFIETVHLAAVGLWFGTLVASGAVAAVVFPTMKNLDVRLPGYEFATAENYRVAGGMVAQQVFLVADVVMFACSTAAFATLAVLLAIYKMPVKRPANAVRILALGLALAAFASMLLILTPALNTASRLHWAAIKAGDAAAMAQHRSAVDQLHPIASNLMAGMALAVFVAFIVGVWALAVPWAGAEARTTPKSPYPEPALLRQKRL